MIEKKKDKKKTFCISLSDKVLFFLSPSIFEKKIYHI